MLAARVERAMASAGLTPTDAYLSRYPFELSGGQRQRVVIAAALALEPSLLIADEPVSMLDVSIRADILNLLSALAREQGIAVVMITHDLSTVAAYADRIAVMYLGRIVEHGPTRDVLRDPQHPYARALLSVVPIPDPTVRRQPVILGGETPDPSRIPSGCRFHPRCPVAFDRCPQVDPPLYDGGAGPPCRLPPRRGRAPRPLALTRPGQRGITSADRHQRDGDGGGDRGQEANQPRAHPRDRGGDHRRGGRSDQSRQRRREGVGQRRRCGTDLPFARHHHAEHDHHEGAEQAGTQRGGPCPGPPELRRSGRRGAAGKGGGHCRGRRQRNPRIGGRRHHKPGEGDQGSGEHAERGDPGQRAGPVLRVLGWDDVAEANADRDEVIIGRVHAATSTGVGAAASRRPRILAPSSRTIQPAWAAR